MTFNTQSKLQLNGLDQSINVLKNGKVTVQT